MLLQRMSRYPPVQAYITYELKIGELQWEHHVAWIGKIIPTSEKGISTKKQPLFTSEICKDLAESRKDSKKCLNPAKMQEDAKWFAPWILMQCMGRG